MSPEPPIFGPADKWPPGTIVKGDYVIERKLGRGGFGTAYRARHRFLDSVHVIKRLHEEFAADETFVRKFIREGQAIRRLNACPNIVKVEHMTQTEDGYLILVMEFIDGGSLEDYLKGQGPLTAPEAMQFGLQIANGLKAVHGAGWVHRDLKPDNVMLAKGPGGLEAKLIDFGLVTDPSAATASAFIGVSAGYTAPEQFEKAAKELDGRTDLYALGAVLFRALAGRKTFDNPDPLGYRQQVLSNPAPQPGAVRSGIPAALDQLVVELLAPQRENRPPSADAVITRLEAMLRPAPPETAAPAIPPQPEPEKRFPWALVVEKKVEEPKPQLQKPPEPAPPKEEVRKEEPRKDEAPKRETAKPKPEPQKPDLTKAEEPAKPAVPAVDHLKEGDAARDRGDFAGALQHYRQAPDGPARLAAMRRSVESEVEERVGVLSDRGDFAGAERLVDLWLGEYRDSQRLQAQKKLIQKRRESQ
jgi:serine/threonine protein kinase